MNTNHKCWVFDCKMVDVTTRSNKGIYCRRCGKKLQDFEVDEKTLKAIRKKMNEKKSKKNGKGRR